MSPYFLTLLLSFGINTIFFVFAALWATDAFTDFTYGATFVIMAWALVFISDAPIALAIILALMITLWGIRLATYLFLRIKKIKKDRRFDGIRERPLKFAQFWLLQAISVWIIMLPAIHFITSGQNSRLTFIALIGIGVWLTGLITEAVADAQKFAFKNNPANKGRFIQTGLWKYSRHPNYFGEMLVWWGIFIYTIPSQNELSWLTITGPLFISALLLFVTGVPTLEKRYDTIYKNNQEYQKYKRKTHIILLLPAKK